MAFLGIFKRIDFLLPKNAIYGLLLKSIKCMALSLYDHIQ